MDDISWNDQLPDIQRLLAWRNSDFQHVSNVIKSIRSFDISSSKRQSFDQLKDLWIQLVSMIPLGKVQIGQKFDGQTEPPFLLRARPNESKYFSAEHEISFNSTRKDLIRWGRFNKPEESVFYASIPTNQTQHSVLTGLLEAEKRISDDDCKNSFFDLTVGKWTVMAPFYAINLCLDETHAASNPTTSNGMFQLLDGIFEVSGAGIHSLVKEAWEFLTSYTCKKNPSDDDYLKSASLFWAIKEYYAQLGEEVNGICYPSAKTEKIGLNVVLTENTVNNFLMLDRVVMLRVKRSEDNNSFNIFPLCDDVAVKDGTFQFGIVDESKEGGNK